MTLVGKVALITGAGTGIGQGIALEMARRGAKVAVHYNQSASGANRTKQAIETSGGEALLVQADVAVRADIERMIGQVTDAFGDLHILVNNAALQLNDDFFEYDEPSYDRMMAINVKGYWQCIRAAVPHMKKNRFGRIINISSVHAKRPTDFDPVYAMTKGAVRMLGREAAIELAPYGITVNTIEPGAVDVGKGPAIGLMTPEQKRMHEEKLRRKFRMGRVGLPHDVARLACFIAEDENDYLNGSAVRLDGGSMHL